ncbi:MAG: oligosaccharide flippase family protein [Hyphomicrobiaceae bacterium]
MAEQLVPSRCRSHVARQGALLVGGYAAAQAFALLRNALLAYMLTKGDFGMAAVLTMTLQVIEMLTDPAIERMIAQAEDGDSPVLLGASHVLTIARGLIIALAILLVAPFAGHLFGVEGLETAIRWLAAVSLVKAFMHLDCRRQQRRLDNRSSVLVELVPQALAAAAAYPVVLATGDYTAVLWINAILAVAMIVTSHLLATERYRLAFDRAMLVRLLRFGWPIIVCAVPLLAVFHGDRLIVARYMGIESLAAYTAVFLATMVPGTLATRAGTSLMLPLIAEARASTRVQAARFRLMNEIAVVAAAIYVAGFAIAGGLVVWLGFGDKYLGNGALAAALAVMWAVRIIQVPPTVLLLAAGETRTLLVAGFVRAGAILLVLAAAEAGADMAVLALCGALGEVVAMIPALRRIGAIHKGQVAPMLRRVAGFPLALAALLPLWNFSERVGVGAAETFAVLFAVVPAVALAGILAMPALREEALSMIAGVRRPAIGPA